MGFYTITRTFSRGGFDTTDVLGYITDVADVKIYMINVINDMNKEEKAKTLRFKVDDDFDCAWLESIEENDDGVKFVYSDGTVVSYSAIYTTKIEV